MYTLEEPSHKAGMKLKIFLTFTESLVSLLQRTKSLYYL